MVHAAHLLIMAVLMLVVLAKGPCDTSLEVTAVVLKTGLVM